MSKINNCIYFSCDRCGHSAYATSPRQAENLGWGVDVIIDGEKKPMDLCPKCKEEWDNFLHGFLYGV